MNTRHCMPALFVTLFKEVRYALLPLLFFASLYAFADDNVAILITDGADQSAHLGAVGNIVRTLQHVALNWIAPLFGTGLAVYGIYKIALRETMVGTIALLCGGAMFFVKNILEGLKALTGAG